MKISELPESKYKTWFYTECGRRIRACRLDICETQEALASALDISRVSMVNIENGKQRLPLHTISEIARLLDVSVNEIVPSMEQYKDYKNSLTTEI